MVSKNPIKLLLVSAAVFLSHFLSTAQELQESTEKKALTFLVYIAADNDLADFVEQDLVEMEKIGSTKHLNTLVYLNTKSNGKKITQRIMIEKNSRVIIDEENGRDSGDPQTLIDACAWAHTYFPSDQFVLVLWDHGTGAVRKTGMRWSWGYSVEGDSGELRAVCFDDTTYNYLNERDLAQALETVCDEYRGGKKIDIIAFDACLMACIEVACGIAPYADFMVASQETIPGKGFGYHHVLKKPARKPLKSFDLARYMPRAYSKEYSKRTRDYTLSVVDLSWLAPLEQSMNEIARVITDFLEDPQDGPIVRGLIHESKKHENCVHFSTRTYLDIEGFFKMLINRLSREDGINGQKKEYLIRLLKTALEDLNVCVIANVYGKAYDQTCGLSLYFRRKNISSSYYDLAWAQKTHWLSLLQAYDRA